MHQSKACLFVIRGLIKDSSIQIFHPIVLFQKAIKFSQLKGKIGRPVESQRLFVPRACRVKISCLGGQARQVKVGKERFRIAGQSLLKGIFSITGAILSGVKNTQAQKNAFIFRIETDYFPVQLDGLFHFIVADIKVGEEESVADVIRIVCNNLPQPLGSPFVFSHLDHQNRKLVQDIAGARIANQCLFISFLRLTEPFVVFRVDCPEKIKIGAGKVCLFLCKHCFFVNNKAFID